MLLDGLAHARQLDDFLVDEGLHVLPLVGRLDLHRLLRLGIHRVGDFLAADGALENVEGDLVDHEMIGRHFARHHRLAEAEIGVDGNDGAVAVGRVHGEHHPGGIGVGHLLEADGERDVFVREAHADAVGDGPCRKQAGDAAAGVQQQIVHAADPQVGVLLPGETRAGQILGGGAGAHRHRHRRHHAAHGELAVVLGDGVFQFPGEGMLLDHLADRLAGCFQLLEIVVAAPFEHARNLPAHPGVAHEARVAVGGQGEARRHAHAGVDELAQRRALAADQRDILLAHFFEPAQLRGRRLLGPGIHANRY